MYSGDLSPRDRAGPAAAVALVHVALAAMLLTLSGSLAPVAVDSTLKLLNVREVPPPPPPPPPRPKPRAKAEAVRSSEGTAPDRKSEASPVVAPVPELVLPTRAPIVAAIEPQQGAAVTQGLAPVLGPGTGGGGSDSGTGAGASGSGGGAGGEGGDDTHPRPLFHSLSSRVFPRDLIEDLPRGTRVFILFTVEADGRISDCSVRQSSGDASLDATVCQVAEQRFRYQPARHGDGTPFASKAGYMQVF